MREQCKRGREPSSVPLRVASDVKAAGMPEPSHAGRTKKIREKGIAARKASRQQEMDSCVMANQ